METIQSNFLGIHGADSMRILLVEDDPLLGDGIRAGLGQAGYVVDWVTSGESAAHALAAEDFDLLVLDLGLPHKSGLEVLTELRGRNDPLPVLILTARDTVADRVQGLDLGADDYLTKPFDLEELYARIRALLRRSGGQASPCIQRGELVLDPRSHRVRLAGKEIELPQGEYRLLELLLQAQGRVLTRSHIEQSLYGWTRDIESNTIEVFVHHLRKKLGRDLIRTVRGVGYAIDRLAEND